MPIYTGRTADGSDMKEFEGVYVNPENDNEWSSEPYPSQAKSIRKVESIKEYMNGKYCLNDVYLQIKEKKCGLSFKLRQFVLSHYDSEGNFIAGN
tara:strand:+ start:7228 stop:7512 length:285 start_codon:yes stop_codon:yes gene_type:complete